MSDAGWTRAAPKNAGYYWTRTWHNDLVVSQLIKISGQMKSRTLGQHYWAFTDGRSDREWWPHPIAPPRDDVVKEDA